MVSLGKLRECFGRGAGSVSERVLSTGAGGKRKLTYLRDFIPVWKDDCQHGRAT